MTTDPSFVIGNRAVFVLSLDDPAMQHELEVTVTSAGKTLSRISGTVDNLGIVLDDLLSRGSDGGWDQPAGWTRTAHRAYHAAVKQLRVTGFDVVIHRDAGIARATIVRKAGA